MKPTLLLLIASCLVTLTASAVPTWTTGAYTEESYVKSDRNLIAGATPVKQSGLDGTNEANGTPTALTDGIVPTKAEAAQYPRLCQVSNNAVAEYSFVDGACTITDVRIYSMWKDAGRDKISIRSIEVKPEGASTWETIANSSVSYEQDSWMNVVTLADPNGEPLAIAATDIRINFDAQENGYVGYAEIEVNGTPASFSPEDPRVSISIGKVMPRKAFVSIEVLDCGEGASLVDLYFGYGTDPSSIVATCITNGLTAGMVITNLLTGLELETTYFCTAYLVNENENTSSLRSSSFITKNASTPRWTGLSSTRWSDPLNWDTEVAPTPDTTYQNLILEVSPGCQQPLELDIPGLTINNLYFGVDGTEDMVVSGLPLSLRYIRSEADEPTRSLTISNTVSFVGQYQNHTARGYETFFMGPVSGSEGLHSANNGNIYFLHENPDFQGRIDMNVGTFAFYGEENLGPPPRVPAPLSGP